MTTHGEPGWSFTAERLAHTSRLAANRARELRRMLFELRLLLENTGDIAAALDAVDALEGALNLPSVPPLMQIQNSEQVQAMEVNNLLDAAIAAVTPGLAEQGVNLLRRTKLRRVVAVQRSAVLSLVRDALLAAASACAAQPSLPVLKVWTRVGPEDTVVLQLEHGGAPLRNESLAGRARHVEVSQDAARGIWRMRFLRCHRPC